MEKRITIGFIDEDAYDEYHNMLTKGIYDYAREHGINVVRFGHFRVNTTVRNLYHEKMLLDFVKQFRLDGIVFLGWGLVAHNSGFPDILGDIPLVSVGSIRPGIHGVFFRGEKYLGQILHHLVQKHGYRKIAYIPPFLPDNRNEMYLSVMNEYGIFDPQLVVERRELIGLDVTERGKRAVEILLDERGVFPQAIVSLYNEETLGVVSAIRERGLRIPEDIAVTSYEDGEIGRFSSPAYTTVYFPWKELGYYSCETLHRLIMGEDVPMETEVPGKVVYRESCGCVPRLAVSLDEDRCSTAGKLFEQLDDNELEVIAGQIAGSTPFSHEEISGLVGSFRQAFYKMEYRPFLMGFEKMLRKMVYSDEPGAYEMTAANFRKALMPYFLPCFSTDLKKLIWADNIFNQMQGVLHNKLATAVFMEHVEYNRSQLILREVGKILLTNFNVDSLKESLAANLPRIGVKGCWLYLFDEPSEHMEFSDYHAEFRYSDGEWQKDHPQHGQDARGFLTDCIFSDEGPHFLLAYLLYMGDEFTGFLLIEAEGADIRIMRILSNHVSLALNSIILFERLDRSYRRLMEQAHRKGMADTTGILHNIANIMNTVNTTQQALENLLESSCLDDLMMANEMLSQRFGELEEFIRNDEKGKLLVKFYATLGDSFIRFRNDLKNHVERLLERVSLIEALISTQQTLTGIKSSLERLDVIPVIENVLKLNRSSIEKAGIDVVRRYDKSVRALAQSTKLFHVLANVVKNAVESMENTEDGEKVLTIEVTRDNKHVFIRVGDTGPGIEEGKLESIFAYGFTTKQGGHGFGLHSCANYMTEMKGRIWAENAKDGRGAVFVMQFRAPS